MVLRSDAKKAPEDLRLICDLRTTPHNNKERHLLYNFQIFTSRTSFRNNKVLRERRNVSQSENNGVGVRKRCVKLSAELLMAQFHIHSIASNENYRYANRII